MQWMTIVVSCQKYGLDSRVVQMEEDFIKANPEWVKELQIMVTTKVFCSCIVPLFDPSNNHLIVCVLDSPSILLNVLAVCWW